MSHAPHPPTAIVAGLGGLGCMAAQVLVTAGVRVTAYEADTVASSNLHRQVLYHQGDVGRVKGAVAADRLGENLTVMPEIFCAGMPLPPHDVFLECTDDSALKLHLEETPPPAGHLIIGSCLGLQGFLWCKPRHHPTKLADFFGEPDPALLARTCARDGVLGPAVNWVGALMAREALAALSGRQADEGVFLRIDAATLQARRQRIPCPDAA